MNLKKVYEKPRIDLEEVIVENSLLNASIPIHVGGLNGEGFEYNTLDEENIVDEWIVNDN